MQIIRIVDVLKQTKAVELKVLMKSSGFLGSKLVKLHHIAGIEISYYLSFDNITGYLWVFLARIKLENKLERV